MRGGLAWIAVALAACTPTSDVSRELGARCDNKAECAEKCLPDSTEFPGGFCTLSCLADDDCPGEAVCVAAEGGVCLHACAADPDCGFLGQGWRCGARERLGGETVTVCSGED
jgi:hypothetical protein